MAAIDLHERFGLANLGFHDLAHYVERSEDKKAAEVACSKWTEIYFKHSRGEKVSKLEVLEALKSGAPIPAKLAPMFTRIVEGTYSFKYSRSESKEITGLTRIVVCDWAVNAKRWIENPALCDLDAAKKDFETKHRLWKSRRTKTGSSQKMAEDFVCTLHGITSSQLNQTLRAARKHAREGFFPHIEKIIAAIADPGTLHEDANWQHRASIIKAYNTLVAAERSQEEIQRELLRLAIQFIATHTHTDPAWVEGEVRKLREE